MKKIAIAGAGHGGLVAGAILAKNGYDVTVYEKGAREELGHDWEDRFTFSLLLSLTDNVAMPAGSWRYRGDCAFVSPSHSTKVVIRYNDETRQKVAWRKPVLQMLNAHAEACGVRFSFSTEVLSPIVENDAVVGIRTSAGEVRSDLVIDAAGAFSPVRTQLPDAFSIEKQPKYGDLFYAYRAYFDRLPYEETDVPFEVYLYHEGEKGLSWHLVNENSVDVLIGRIYPLTEEKVKEQLDIFRKNHPCTGQAILHGGTYGIIPVRRPLTKMVANGYAAVGDSAFMTTPMNGMGIDLSLQAGKLLAETVLSHDDCTAASLWDYNRTYHERFAFAAKNEGLKNALLSLPSEGVDFLFDHAVIQASDLGGAGRNTSFSSLLGKLVRGMKQPKTFFAIVKGLLRGGKAARLYQKAPKTYDEEKLKKWDSKISALDILLS